MRRWWKALTDKDGAPVFGPLLIFFTVIVLKIWFVRWTALGSSDLRSAILLEGGVVLLTLAVVGMLFARGRLWAYLTVNIVVTLILVSTRVYVTQFQQVPTADTLAFAGQLSEVADSVVELIRPSYVFAVADIIILGAWVGATAPDRKVAGRFDSRLVASIALGLAWTAVVAGVLVTSGPVADSVAGAARRGLITYELLGGSVASASETDELPPARTDVAAGPVDINDPVSVQREVDRLLGAHAPRVDGAPEPGAYAGKNVLLIQAEALQSFVVGAEIEGAEITPNLNDLIGESWYAPAMITQIGRGNTSDAEFIANTSLLTRKKTPSSTAWGSKAVPSLPRALAEQGYRTQTMHANTVQFWNRDELYPALGFESYRDVQFFGTADVVGMGASDEVFFSKAVPVLEGLSDGGEPFYAQLVTLSAHQPFKAAAARSDLPLPEELEGTTLGRYLRAQNYADEQLGNAIERLKDDGLWDDTVVVVYGDHFALTPQKLGPAETPLLEEFTGRQYTDAQQFQVPLIVHLPGQVQPRRLDGAFGQVDIMPTIAELLGVDVSGMVHFGRSVFEGGAPIVPVRHNAPEGTFATDDWLFRPGMGFEDGAAHSMEGVAGRYRPSLQAEYDAVIGLQSLNIAYLKALPEHSKTATATPQER